MFKEENVVLYVQRRVISSSKIRVQDEDVMKTVSSLFEYYKYFNSLPENTDRALNSDISLIPILSEFVDVLLPNSVRWNPSDRRTKDLLVRNSAPKEFKGSLNELMDLQLHFRKYFKKDTAENVVKLSDVRVDKSLSDVFSHASIVLKGVEICSYDGSPYIPLMLNEDVLSLLTNVDAYFNSKADDVIKDYYALKLF